LRELAQSHPGTLASEVPPLPPERDAGDARSRKLMSRAARLGAIALREALRDAGFADERLGVGAFLGVGASGGPMSELDGMLRGGLDGERFSLTRLGREGLAACNPLLTFQLLNNFSLCHGAILEGVGGPNSAFYSRGAGTVAALVEAAHAVAAGDCAGALAGGADSALHPVTWSELRREGWAAQGLVPAEGAAVLALRAPGRPGPVLAQLCAARVEPGRGRPLARAAAEAARAASGAQADLAVLAPWGDPARAALLAAVAEACPGAVAIDASAALGDALAAAPALAWAAAADLLREGACARALVLSAGIDGDAGAVLLRAPFR
jgi:3-oxoacyl-[acyl-carrier-protein] synthase II